MADTSTGSTETPMEEREGRLPLEKIRSEIMNPLAGWRMRIVLRVECPAYLWLAPGVVDVERSDGVHLLVDDTTGAVLGALEVTTTTHGL